LVLNAGTGHEAIVLVMVIEGSLTIAFALMAVSPQLSRQMNTDSAYLQSFGQEKEGRTPEQQKIDSQLLYAIYQMRGVAAAKGVPTEPIQLEKDTRGRVLVDVRAPVTKKMLSRVQKLGGQIVNTSKDYHSIVAYLSLEKLEALARTKEVKFISPKAQAMTH
jgi:hypothetical protein